MFIHIFCLYMGGVENAMHGGKLHYYYIIKEFE